MSRLLNVTSTTTLCDTLKVKLVVQRKMSNVTGIPRSAQNLVKPCSKLVLRNSTKLRHYPKQNRTDTESRMLHRGANEQR